MTEGFDMMSILQERMPPFSKLLGIRFISADPERVLAEMMVTEDLCTTPAILHGGAIMAFADTIGAFATVINLQDGYGINDYRVQDKLLCPGAGGNEDYRRMHSPPPRQTHYGLADPHNK